MGKDLFVTAQDNGNGPSAEAPQHSLLHSILLHLLPGAAITLVYIIAARPAMNLGFPPLMALLVAALMAGIPLELGHLYWHGRKRNRRFSLAGVVLYRTPVRVRQHITLVAATVVVAFVLLGFLVQFDTVIARRFFAWLPGWYFMSDLSQYAAYSRSALLLTFLVRLGLDGLSLPIVEELYFRGYLLPRISRFGWWAPVINHLLFTVYHFWQPFNYLTIFFGVLPLTLAVWWKRSVKLGIFAHCAINLIGAVSTLAFVLGNPRP